MKNTAPDNSDKEQELQRFKAASERLVRSAAQDPAVAREFLHATGYFAVMAKANANANANAAAHKTAAVGKTALKGKVSRAQGKKVKAR